MQTNKSKWDVERAAAWLRNYTGGSRGAEGVAPAPLDPDSVLAAAQAEADAAALLEQEAGVESGAVADAAASGADDDIDIAGWPALVAPFYD